jgi:hypothetical protein
MAASGGQYGFAARLRIILADLKCKSLVEYMQILNQAQSRASN